MTAKKNRQATASKAAINRIFTIPEKPESSLGRIEQQLSQDLAGFLQDNIAALEKPLSAIEKDFQCYRIPSQPRFVSDYVSEIMQNLVAHSVHTASPSFIGHMTSALPYFVLPLSKMMVGLNQNLVKIETSKAFTPLERQVLGMMHHLVYQQTGKFYKQWQHSANHALGAFCSGGTVANITALWIARNNLLAAQGDFKGVAREGLPKALKHYGWENLAILVSKRGHYSLGKAADILGIGRDNIIYIDTDEHHKVDVSQMRLTAEKLTAQNIKILSIVGIAGTTETGNIDPLRELAKLSQEVNCHFHIDAAWGGATLMSAKYQKLLAGIALADSVTIDAHKQLYVPMGAGMVLFKNPTAARSIELHAEYILRKGSKDLGSKTLEGSRSGMAMMVHACLQIIGKHGYSILIDDSIEKAHFFADLIQNSTEFELTSTPELCLLTYRYIPAKVQQTMVQAYQQGNTKLLNKINALLDELTCFIQKKQREEGNSFVSRTRIPSKLDSSQKNVVFRVVLANPLTTEDILRSVLTEQITIAKKDRLYLPKLLALTED